MHVLNSMEVTVMIPMNRLPFLLRHRHDVAAANDELDQLGSHLAGDAVCIFNGAVGVEAALTYGREQHKQRDYVQRSDMELEAVQYCATHPASVGVDRRNNHMLYLYRSKGLQRQHPHQFTLIGQCITFIAAAALLKAVNARLGVLYRRDRVRFWAGMTTEAMAGWDAACHKVGLAQGPAHPTTIRQMLPEDPSDDIRAMLRGAACATSDTDKALESFLGQLGLAL